MALAHSARIHVEGTDVAVSRVIRSPCVLGFVGVAIE